MASRSMALDRPLAVTSSEAPKEYAFSGAEVYIKKIDGVVMLIPKDAPWKPFFDSLNKFTDDFMMTERSQETAQNREPLE